MEQIRPSSYPEGLLSNKLRTMNLTHTWHKYGTCPEGTVPIKRSINSYNSKTTLPFKYFVHDGYVHRAKNQETTNSGEVNICIHAYFY